MNCCTCSVRSDAERTGTTWGGTSLPGGAMSEGLCGKRRPRSPELPGAPGRRGFNELNCRHTQDKSPLRFHPLYLTIKPCSQVLPDPMRFQQKIRLSTYRYRERFITRVHLPTVSTRGLKRQQFSQSGVFLARFPSPVGVYDLLGHKGLECQLGRPGTGRDPHKRRGNTFGKPLAAGQAASALTARRRRAGGHGPPAVGE